MFVKCGLDILINNRQLIFEAPIAGGDSVQPHT